jgi:hypothetical protein
MGRVLDLAEVAAREQFAEHDQARAAGARLADAVRRGAEVLGAVLAHRALHEPDAQDAVRHERGPG